MILAGIDLDRLPVGRTLTAAYALILGIGLTDYLTGSEISVSLLYLFPVFLAVWVSGPGAGWTIAVCATLVELAADVAAGHGYSHFLIIWWNAALRFGFLGVALLLLAALKRSLESEGRSARQDFLTGALNSRAFYETAEAERQRAFRYHRPFTLVFLDLDNFKLVNDRQGHHAGDEVLRVVARTLQGSVRATDRVARLGGDEFVLLLPESDARRTAGALGRLRAGLSRAMDEGGWDVTFSLGAATFVEPPESVDGMLKLADRLMYAAKTAGKNRVKAAVFSGLDPVRSPRVRKRPRGA
jgi:diguanylate cyclase (GGDEF)-like protein